MFISKSEYEDLKYDADMMMNYKRKYDRIALEKCELNRNLTHSELEVYTLKMKLQLAESQVNYYENTDARKIEKIRLEAQKAKIEAKLAKLEAEPCPESQLTVGEIDSDKLCTAYQGTGEPENPHTGDVWYRYATSTQDSGVFRYTKYGDWIAESDEQKYTMYYRSNIYLGLQDVGTPEETIIGIHHPYPMTIAQIEKHVPNICLYKEEPVDEEEFYED